MDIGGYGIGSNSIDITNGNLFYQRGHTGFYKGLNVEGAPSTDWWYFIIQSHDGPSGFISSYIAISYWDTTKIYLGLSFPSSEDGSFFFTGWNYTCSVAEAWEIARRVANELANEYGMHYTTLYNEDAITDLSGNVQYIATVKMFPTHIELINFKIKFLATVTSQQNEYGTYSRGLQTNWKHPPTDYSPTDSYYAFDYNGNRLDYRSGLTDYIYFAVGNGAQQLTLYTGQSARTFTAGTEINLDVSGICFSYR